jgi:hypothetical protein
MNNSHYTCKHNSNFGIKSRSKMNIGWRCGSMVMGLALGWNPTILGGPDQYKIRNSAL